MSSKIEEYKIWYPYEVFYIESMLTITRSALSEVEVFHEVIKQIISQKPVNKKIIIDALQNFITYSASLSRYFWPTNKESIPQLRGERLREAFSVEESSPLKDRKLRNFIEHFDEKLDSYLSKGMFGNVIPMYVGYKSHTSPEVDHFFRAYFLDQAIFKVLDLEYKVDPIIQEVVRVHNLLIDFSEKGGRLPTITLH